MEAVFAVNQYPDFKSREALADAIDLSEARIQVRYGLNCRIKTIKLKRTVSLYYTRNLEAAFKT